MASSRGSDAVIDALGPGGDACIDGWLTLRKGNVWRVLFVTRPTVRSVVASQSRELRRERASGALGTAVAPRRPGRRDGART
jgi:hypothetical protein